MGIAGEPHHFRIDKVLLVLLHVRATKVVVRVLRVARGRGDSAIMGMAAVGALVEVKVALCWWLLGRGGRPVAPRRALPLYALG